MEILHTEFKGLFIIKPKVFKDTRGYFMESFREDLFTDKIGNIRFVQENESVSTFGVLRGLHYQLPPFAQSKLVRVVKGKVQDIAVDLRYGSDTFGKYFSIQISEENKLQLFIPKGFAHGFLVLSDEAVFQYKCDNYYAPDYETDLRWNDKHIKIIWELNPNDIVLSEKDKNALSFMEAVKF